MNKIPSTSDPHPAGRELPAGHPLELFRRENAAIGRLVHELRGHVATGTGAARLRAAAARLPEIEHHYARKESLFFAYLEKHGVIDLARRMWREDGAVRRRLHGWLQKLAAAPDAATDADLADEVRMAATELFAAITAMIGSEEEQLLPLCAARFTDEDWAEIRQESPRFGICLVEPGEAHAPAPPAAPPHLAEGAEDKLLELATGRLTLRQLEALFATLPLDLTLTDAEDRIVFYSDWPGRHFSRCPAILGRPLAHCHPPASEALLERVMDDLRGGQARVIEAAMERDGRTILSRYIAVQDGKGAYIGCLEVVEDITRFQELGRDGRLPAYDAGTYS